MDAHSLVPAESVPASRKLGRDDAMTLAAKARRMPSNAFDTVAGFERELRAGADCSTTTTSPTASCT